MFVKGYTVQFLHRVSVLSEALSVSVVVNLVDILLPSITVLL